MNSNFGVFPYLWLTIVAVMGAVSLAKGIYELDKGEARTRFWSGDFSSPMTRDGEPFYYWLIIGGDFAGVVVTGFMFWMGLDMFRS